MGPTPSLIPSGKSIASIKGKQPIVKPSRKSTRGVARPDSYKDTKTYKKSAKAAKALTSTNIPKTYKQAMESPNSKEWLEAIQSEEASLRENNTWTLVKPLKEAHILHGRWVFSQKIAENGQSIRYKARWVVKGFEQREGIEYSDVFASVVKTATWKTLVAIATAKGWFMEQMDIVTAFLHGDLQETIYVEQPHGIAKGTLVCKLNKALYGLKQSPRAWYKHLSAKLKDLKYTRSSYDHSLFYSLNQQVYVTIYVDDFVIFGPNFSAIKKLKEELSKVFKMKDLSPLKCFLGQEVTRSEETTTIS